MHAVVYRTATRLRHNQHRVVCQLPAFAKSAGASENSIISSGRSLSDAPRPCGWYGVCSALRLDRLYLDPAAHDQPGNQ